LLVCVGLLWQTWFVCTLPWPHVYSLYYCES
jgi:hypothetical protein